MTIPCQVEGREMPSDTLLQRNRARWAAGSDTWNTFAGIPWQVDGGMRHLEHFRRKTVAGGQRDETPGTLLERFRGDTVAGGQRDETPGTL